ncbi:LLM class F420-dependent oxidoreductase [Cellvibrio zantedeschiae]|uniref:LLM class F420-dependent oxidoreductase n=1 Tax=Cellvibrio zantedeschiae TaxID=1237077 RepID=A0ABQ3B638_9GAMM|nr:TIGR03885 family FMN-dependent LLM class oxidoreductase [Cellvibrio zantedeschiae]GGY78905.1 LLM class F420-dependent oxidoreductase [Cellvibrio zantedeschiae]
MAILSYHASHEQFSPSDLLAYVKLAEQAGFHGCHSSDHFHPWSERQGQSGYVFSWLGAAMEATQFPFSVITAPGQRYHPAIVAQAIGTLLQMYPNRLGISLGSGEALNECITGDAWPEKPIRNQRLLECAQIIKRLLAGEEVTHTGLVNVHRAKLYTRPATTPSIMCAALSKETAAWAGSWADGLLTTYQPEGRLEEIIAAFCSNGGEGKPVHVKLTFSFAQDEQLAHSEAHHQWRFDCIDKLKLAELRSVADFDNAAKDISPEKVASTIPISNSVDHFIRLINKIESMGVNHIVLHNVGRNQEEFITAFGNGLFRR